MRLHAQRAFVLLALFFFATPELRANCSSHPVDVAPGTMGNQVPVPTWTVIGNGVVDVQDVLALLNAAVGRTVLAWSQPVQPDCGLIPGNVSPGMQDDGFSPARWTPAPDDAVDVGDVLVALRLTVALIELDPDWLVPIVADAQVDDRVVAGSVIDSVTSSGLPAVEVTALLDDAPVGQTSTDAQGKFLLQGLPVGLLSLRLDGSATTASGKFSSLVVEVAVESESTTSVQPITLPDESDPAGASGKFSGDEEGTLDEEVDLSSGDGDVGLQTGPGGKIEIDGEPAEGDVDLSVVPISGEDLPEELVDEDSGDSLNSTGEVAVGPAEGKFTGGDADGSAAGLSVEGGPIGFDLTLPNRKDLPISWVLDIWHWNGESWTNHSQATGHYGEVIDLGGGMSAVRAAGVATEGGLYAAALPVDLSCVSSVSGTIRDQGGAPLAEVFVGTSLGASGFTDALGNFLLEDVPAYTGLGLGDCEPVGYELVVRAGVELGSPTTSRMVLASEVVLGADTALGAIDLVVPDLGCVSGLVLANDVPQSGPVTIDGPESDVLMADEEGRFFRAGLAPGAYRAAFQFEGEPIAREFDFDIVARECSTLRLAVTGGEGSQRLVVDVRYDHDGDLLSPSRPVAGALVRLVGSDRISAFGLETASDSNGQATFENVDPPYEIVAILERALPGDEGLERAETDDGPYMRLGAALVTPAPLARVSLLLRLPSSVEASDPVGEGLVTGSVSNLPALGPDEHHEVSALRRGYYDEPWGAEVESGDYAADAFLAPFDLAVAVRDDAPPHRVREMALLGPFQLPPQEMEEEDPLLTEYGSELNVDLNYAMGHRLVFAALPFSYSNLVTSGNPKHWAAGGGRADGRSFWTFDGEAAASGAFPFSVNVPPLGGTDLDMFLELGSNSDGPGQAQSCLVPIRPPRPPCVLPPCLNVDFLLPPSIQAPAGPSVDEGNIVNGYVHYQAATNQSAKGFDAVRYETSFPEAGAGELAVTSFLRWLPAGEFGSSTIGETASPFVFPDMSLDVGVETYRGEGLPARHTDLFGPTLDEILRGLPLQPEPTCRGMERTRYIVSSPL